MSQVARDSCVKHPLDNTYAAATRTSGQRVEPGPKP
jgi:hypothetical protein